MILGILIGVAIGVLGVAFFMGAHAPDPIWADEDESAIIKGQEVLRGPR